MEYHVFINKETEKLLWIIWAFLLFIFQIATIIVVEHRRPNKAIAWLIILFLFPLIGFLLYYFVAKEYSHRRTVRRKANRHLEQMKADLSTQCRQQVAGDLLDQTIRHENKLLALLKNIPFAPITTCNETTVFADGAQAFEAMLEAMAEARDHIHIEFYIIRDDNIGTRFQHLMTQKAKQGVKVRLLYDGIGSHQLGDAYLKQLHDAGVETGCFLPPLVAFIDKRINYRNHRKILVVDGKIGFFGGLNIGDEYLGKDPKRGFWRDTHLSIRGDAVLWLQHTFLTDWCFVKGQVFTNTSYFPMHECHGEELVQIVKSGPDAHWDIVLEVFFTFIVSAKKRIYIETPYFIPDPSVLMALKMAAICGIDVRIISPANSDSKLVQWASLSYVQELLQAGVHFYLYQKGFIHAKVIIVDHLVCSGSANMDMRSFYGQFEINAIFFDRKVVDCFEEDFIRDLSESKEILLADFEKRPRSQKMKEAFTRLLSPLF